MNLFTLSATIDLDTSAFASEVQSASSKVEDLRKELSQAGAQSDSFGDRLSDALDMDDARASINRATLEIDKLKEKIKQSSEEIATLRSGLEQATEEIKSLQAELKSGDGEKGDGSALVGGWQGILEDVKSHLFGFTLGSLIADGIKSGFGTIKDTLFESIDLASSLEEVQNVVDVTFGAGASEIDRWAKSAKNAFGMSELKAKQFTGTMGAMLKSMGLTDSQIVDMSTDLSGLAGDIASFYNLDLDTAFEKIRSGISGETEPLKQLGINMSVVNLQAYAMSQGITKSYDAMTQAEQAMLRYNYLLSVTADAQGDFSRTSGGYANQLRLFEENLNSIKASIGNSLIDAATEALTMLNAWMTGDAFEQNQQEIQQAQNEEEAAENQRYGQASNIISGMEDMLETQGEAAKQTDEWAAAIKALTNVMPELAQYVDETTGEIMANTQQLKQNADAVHDLAIYDAKKRALNSYAQAVEDAEAAIVDKQVNILIKESEVDWWQNLYKEKLQEIADASGVASDQIEKLFETGSDFASLIDSGLVSGKDIDYVYDIIGAIATSEDAVNAARAELVAAEEDADRARQSYEYAEVAVDAYSSGTVAANLAQREYNSALQSQADTLDQLQTAYDDLIAYQGSVRDEMRKTVDSIVRGFTDIPQAAEVSTTDIMDSLREQQRYLDEYRHNLETAREKGLSDAALLELSDSSEESAGVLRAIATMTDAEVAALNEQYAGVQQAKEDVVNSISEVQLAADPVYQEMKDAVTDLVESFNQQDAARTNMLATGSGMISAMDDTIAEMQTRVNTMQALFNQMLGMSLGLSFSGATGIVKPSSLRGGSGGITAATNAKGLDYVPYNEYLTYLHKGEMVLSSTEAEKYRASTMQAQPVIDYDALGAVMAASMAGMSVQMDGRAVGVLIAPTVSQQIDQAAQAGRFNG